MSHKAPTFDDMVSRVRNLRTFKVKGIQGVMVCVRVSKKKTCASGHYSSRRRRMVVTFCKKETDNWEVLLHEFTHAYMDLKFDSMDHGFAYKMTLCHAVSEFTGVPFVFLGSNDMRDLDVGACKHIETFYVNKR